jgi:hypothetical protein
MALIADILLIAGALGAAIYCIVLSRRLKKFNDLETGVGGAVAVMSGQVDDMTKTLTVAQKAAATSTNSLQELTARAEQAAQHLELLVASLHDLPKVDPAASKKTDSPAETKAETAFDELLFLRHREKAQGAAE